jgi:hypothetical protein
MDYSKILTRSFEVVWRYRALWLFGILLALVGGGSGGGGSGFSFPSSPGTTGGREGTQQPFTPPTLPQVNFESLIPIFIAIGCGILLLIIVSIVLRFVCRGALIGLVSELESNQTSPAVGRGFRIGFSRFWSLLGIAFLINLPLALLTLLLLGLAALPIVGALLSSGGRQGLEGIIAAGGITSVLIFCCVILFLILLQFVIYPFYEFIQRACVVENRGVVDSIREGYRIVRQNLGGVLVLYVLGIAMGIAFGIVMFFVALVLFVVLFGAGFVAYLIANSITTAIIVAAIVGIPVFLILIFISGVYQAFVSTYWTEGYLGVAIK